MKKFCKRTLALGMALSMGLAGFAMADDGYVELTGKVNIRKGPGLEYDSYGSKPKGTHLDYAESAYVDDRGVVWYEVEYNSYSNGWVSSKYATLYDYELEVYASGGKSFIRAYPSLDGRKKATFPEGEYATYLNKNSVDDRGVVWFKVEYDGVTGWVSSRYTTLGDDWSEIEWVVAEDGQTNIRAKANLNGKKLGVLPKGASAQYLGEESTDSRGVEWYKVRYNGVTGWVSSRYTVIE